MNKKHLLTMVSFAFILMACFAMTTSAVYADVTIKLDASTLTMNVGETHLFRVLNNEGRVLEDPFLFISSDDEIISIDPTTYVATAHAAGNAVIFVESLDGFDYAMCQITVNGLEEKGVISEKSGNSYITLSDSDLAKIKSGPLLHYIDFINQSKFASAAAFDTVAERIFYVAADVTPGTEEEQSNYALSLGFLVSKPLKELNSITLMGTFSQIMEYTADNADLIVIFGGNSYTSEPIEEEMLTDEEGLIDKAVSLKGNTENLTKISLAHDAGYKGAGQYVAILDTGINKNHEQFKGRVYKEACFSNGNEKTENYSYEYHPVCQGNSSEPSLANKPANFNHGSHVTGIAAGKDGIAPEAKIIAINISYEYCRKSDGYCSDSMWDSDILEGLDKILEFSKSVNIAAVNLSIGGDHFGNYCDKDSNESQYYDKFKSLESKGIIAVVSSGNDGWVEYVSSPACISKAITVGRLDNNSTPYIGGSSNHSTMVDLLAPGTNIWSAYYADDYGNVKTNNYGYMSGTSMAAPMVTGAMALLRQAYPNSSVDEYKNFYQTISTQYINRRLAEDDVWDTYLEEWVNVPAKTFSYSKPILDFTNFTKNLNGTLTLPAGLVRIDESAFYGVAAGTVVISSSCTTIGPKAFANSKVTTVHIPASVTQIDESAFDGCVGVTFVTSNQIAINYANQHGIEVRSN